MVKLLRLASRWFHQIRAIAGMITIPPQETVIPTTTSMRRAIFNDVLGLRRFQRVFVRVVVWLRVVVERWWMKIVEEFGWFGGRAQIGNLTTGADGYRSSTPTWLPYLLTRLEKNISYCRTPRDMKLCQIPFTSYIFTAWRRNVSCRPAVFYME